MAQAPDREKALELAIAQIDKNYGKGSVMRLPKLRTPFVGQNYSVHETLQSKGLHFSSLALKRAI